MLMNEKVNSCEIGVYVFSCAARIYIGSFLYVYITTKIQVQTRIELNEWIDNDDDDGKQTKQEHFFSLLLYNLDESFFFYSQFICKKWLNECVKMNEKLLQSQ